MKKRFAAILLALALCLGLALPALAAELPVDAEAASHFKKYFSDVTLSYDLGDGFTGGVGTGIRVDKKFNAVNHYISQNDGSVDDSEIKIDHYYAIREGTEFTLSFGNSSMDDGGIEVVLLPYINQGDGRYVHNSYDEWYLCKDGSFADEYDPEQLPGAGDAVTFTLPEQEGGDDVLYVLELRKIMYGEAAALSGIVLMVDEAAVDSYLAAQRPAPSPTPTPAPTPEPEPLAFTDVESGEWYAAPVSWAVSKDITNGTGGGKFSPTQTCTHAQILTFLYRADRNGGKAEAADMDKAEAWAREKGMVNGSYNGGALCTRADAVNYIWQALGKKNAEASSFTDVPAGAAYAEAVDWAVANGVTNGTNAAQTQFSPSKVCDRGTIVTFLHRAYVPSARLPV